MIREIKIENLKSLRSNSVSFDRLTLIAGANSSGKSSVLQSLLLWRNGVVAITGNEPNNIDTATFGKSLDLRSLRTHGEDGEVSVSVKFERLSGNTFTVGIGVVESDDLEHGIDQASSSDITSPSARLGSLRISTEFHGVSFESSGYSDEMEELFERDVISGLSPMGRTTSKDAPLIQHIQECLAPDDIGELRQVADGRIFYIGPFRSASSSSTEQHVETGTLVNSDGSATLGVLIRDRARMVTSPSPIDGSLRDVTLFDAVVEWASAMGLFADMELNGEELLLWDEGAQRQLPYSSLGSAVSQCLPVIVSCLRAPTGSTILIEQPEVHLHPRLQQLMGDFLLWISRSNRQVVVETHSDHLIDRVRRRIAETDSQDESHGVLCLFFQRNHRDGATLINGHRFNRFGGLPKWPAGFFDDSQNEAAEMLRAIAKKMVPGESFGESNQSAARPKSQNNDAGASAASLTLPAQTMGNSNFGRNHRIMAEAFSQLSGQIKSTRQLAEILSEYDPSFSPGSMLWNDHGAGNLGACRCAGTDERIFDRLERGTYRIL